MESNKQGDKEMQKEDVVTKLAGTMAVLGCNGHAWSMWGQVAESVVEFSAGGYVEDGAGEVADSIVSGWCIYYGDAEELARGMQMTEEDADEGLAVVLENLDAQGVRAESLAGLTHAAWSEAVRSEIFQRVADMCEQLGELNGEGWMQLGLNNEAAVVAARLWADGSALSVWELVETAGNLTVAGV